MFKDGSTEELSIYRHISGYISIWIVMGLSIDINLPLDRSIHFLHVYY